MSILAGLLLAWTARFFYGVLFEKTETQLKGYLTKRRSIKKYQMRVRLFVAACRGSAEATDSNSLAQLLSMIIVTAVFMSYFASLGFWALGKQIDSSKSRITLQIESLTERMAEMQQLLSDISNQRAVKSLSDAKAEVSDWLERAEILQQDFKADIATMEIWQRATPIGTVFFALLSIGLFVYLLYFSFVVPQRRSLVRLFSFEVSRFTLRMQGLASADELVRLAKSEAQVVDEHSLQEFISAAAAIAKRHDLLELVARFDLWYREPNAT